VSTLSTQLVRDYGQGFGLRSLILCAAHDREQVELLDLDAANIRVAEYLAHIPDIKVLQAQLRRARELARERTVRAALPMDA